MKRTKGELKIRKCPQFQGRTDLYVPKNDNDETIIICGETTRAAELEHLRFCWNAFNENGLVGELVKACNAWQKFADELVKRQPDLAFYVDVAHKFSKAKNLTDALEKAKKL